MARKQDICEVPGCVNEIGNKKRGLCPACASSMYYWNRRDKQDKGAMLERRRKLEFWNGRLDWLFQPHGPKPRKRKS